MAQATLNAAVVLGGRVDNSFTQIGDALLNMSMTVDQISQKLIDFGKDSIGVYREYQDSMLQAEVALATTYGKDSRELKAVMLNLDMWATEMAANTSFTTKEIGNAISEAAHAGYDEEKVITSVGQAMLLAKAGSMDLAQSLNFLARASSAANIPFEELPSFVDDWVYAANRSQATVESYGEAMLRMGPTMQFAENRQELLTMLAVLHDAGLDGAEAGTMLRNSMIRLLAPTEKAATVMSFLGVSEEQINEALAETNGNTKKAAQKLKEFGFSAHDQQGNLKSFTGLFEELADAVDKMTDEDRDTTLSALFPTRTLASGKALIAGARNEWKGLLQDFTDGKSIGYAQYGAEVMMSGLTGSIDIFNSKLERLKQLTGKTLEGDVTNFLSMAGDFIDSIATMDERSFTGLVGGLEGIAATGPALAAAGWGFRFLGQMLGTHTGRIALAATALFAFGKAMNDLAQYDYEQSFGDLSLDSEQIQAYLNGVKQPFIDARKDLDAYKESMEAAVKAYTDTSSQLAQGIITKMVTGTTLTPEEQDSFVKMGESIIGKLKEGMKSGYEARNQSLLLTFGHGDVETAFDNPIFNEIVFILDEDFQSATERAEALSQKLRDALTSAFKDSKLTPEETENIQSVLEELNKELAIQTNAAMYADEERMLGRAQTLGLEGIAQLKKETDEAMMKVLGLRQEEFYQDYGYLKARLEKRRGTVDSEGRLIDQDYIDAMLYNLKINQRDEEYRIRAEYEKMFLRGYNNMVNTSEFADVTDFMGGIADAARNGEADARLMMYEVERTGYGRKSQDKYRRYLRDFISAMGGEETLSGLINQWEKAGDLATAASAQRQLDIYRLYNGDYGSFAGRYNFEKEPKTGNEKEAAAKSVVQSLYSDAKEKAKETKEEIDETLNPTETEIQFNYEENMKAARADMEAMIGKDIDVNVNAHVTQTTSSAGEAGNSGGLIGAIGNAISGVGKFFGGLLGFAEGGRSDVPAIFGEGDTAEWAIPEAHTARTASLLAAAADASGFSWGELASAASSRGGGGSSGGDGIVVHYSPVIHSDNMDGIDHILREDKERLRREIEHLLDERRMYESVVAYT